MIESANEVGYDSYEQETTTGGATFVPVEAGEATGDPNGRHGPAGFQSLEAGYTQD